MIEDGTPVIGIITDEEISAKTISNMKETKARGAKLIAIKTENPWRLKNVAVFSSSESKSSFVVKSKVVL